MSTGTQVREKPPLTISKKKQFLFTLVIFSLFLCLLEIALRLLNLPPTLKEDKGWSYRTNNAMGYGHTPGWSGYRAGAIVTINSFGFRGKEFSQTKPEGTVRILGIGDSMTLGVAVGDDDTFLAQLEGLLNQDGGSSRYETINAGHQNINTRQESRFLRERNLMSLGPDVVILGFTTQNDANLPRAKRYARINETEMSKASLVLRGANSETFKYLASSFRTAKILRSGIDWIYQDTISEVSHRVIVEQYRDGSKSWETCHRALLDIHETCLKNNARLVIVLFPIFPRRADQSLSEYSPEALQIDEKLKAVFAGKEGVTVVSLYEDLAATGLTTQELRVPIDGHPNRLWHGITARRLYSTLRDLGL
jgi:hypothetical protein